MKQQSASALQIKEKLERQEEMLKLAQDETQLLIYKIYRANPQFSDEEIGQEIKNRPFPINAFIQEYLKNVAVSEKIAQSYFNVYSNSLHPVFVKAKLNPKANVCLGFHLCDAYLSFLLDDFRNELKKNCN